MALVIIDILEGTVIEDKKDYTFDVAVPKQPPESPIVVPELALEEVVKEKTREQELLEFIKLFPIENEEKTK